MGFHPRHGNFYLIPYDEDGNIIGDSDGKFETEANAIESLKNAKKFKRVGKYQGQGASNLFKDLVDNLKDIDVKITSFMDMQ